MRRAFALILWALLTGPYVLPSPRIDIPSDLLAASDQVEPRPDYRFTSDGCSGGMSLAWHIATGKGPAWEHCCIRHDFAYWRGGTALERAVADDDLAKCAAASGHPVMGWLMKNAVEPGGVPWLPTAWRWGYGWHFYHPHASGG
jgi:hypothetical protein